ncbi:response regulator transcription factor [Chloroflexota bacterium]
MNFLIISDDKIIAKEVYMYLQVRYTDSEVIVANTGLKGIEMVHTEMSDLAIIDAPLPDTSMIDIIEKIRKNSDVGIISLSDKQSAVERAELLEVGADDYIIKPIDQLEFVAKVNALLRRIKGSGFSQQRAVALTEGVFVDYETREVYANGKISRLSPTEYHLLMELINNDGNVLTNEMILEKVWGADDSINYDSVKRYVYMLRSKIETDSRNPKVILNERGIGYKKIISG